VNLYPLNGKVSKRDSYLDDLIEKRKKYDII